LRPAPVLSAPMPPRAAANHAAAPGGPASANSAISQPRSQAPLATAIRERLPHDPAHRALGGASRGRSTR
jgi:hypothetical protein